MRRLAVLVFLCAPSPLLAEPMQPIPSPGPQNWAIGCYNRVCIAINARGETRSIDLNNDQSSNQASVPGKGPFAIACDNTEYCAVVDAAGRVFKSGLRPPFKWA